jgi:hypothetical protein
MYIGAVFWDYTKILECWKHAVSPNGSGFYIENNQLLWNLEVKCSNPQVNEVVSIASALLAVADQQIWRAYGVIAHMLGGTPHQLIQKTLPIFVCPVEGRMQ